MPLSSEVLPSVALKASEEQRSEIRANIDRERRFPTSHAGWAALRDENIQMDLEVLERSEYEKKHKPKAQQKLYDLLNQCGLTDATTHITTGPTDKTISHLANELKADLVIIGSIGREGVKGFLLGNTAERVLHHLRTDMLIVKSPATRD